MADGIRERKPGVWEVRVSSGRRADGTPRTVSRTVRGTRAEALAERERLKWQLGSSPSFGETTSLGDFWPAFVDGCKVKGLANATIRDYEKNWRLHVEPRFGRVPASSITFGDVQRWVYTMTPGTAHHAARVFKRMLSCAIDAGIVDSNPLIGRRLDYPRPTTPAQLRQDWGANEVIECMRRIEGSELEALWLALVGGGLRLEEGLALDWADVSFSHGGRGGTMAHLSVTKAWTEVDGLKPPKNVSSMRVVPVPDPFASRLEELAGDGPIFRLYRGSASRRWAALFRPGGDLEGMPRACLKDMRSINETMHQEAGTLDTVNARLHGRTNVQTGYKHYLRPSKALDEAASNLGEVLTFRTDARNLG